jgi:hypothetical protein
VAPEKKTAEIYGNEDVGSTVIRKEKIEKLIQISIKNNNQPTNNSARHSVHLHILLLDLMESYIDLRQVTHTKRPQHMHYPLDRSYCMAYQQHNESRAARMRVYLYTNIISVIVLLLIPKTHNRARHKTD